MWATNSKSNTIQVVPRKYSDELIKQVSEMSGVPKDQIMVMLTNDGAQNLRIGFPKSMALNITFRFDHNAKQYVVTEKNGEFINPPVLVTEEPIRSLLMRKEKYGSRSVTTKNEN